MLLFQIFALVTGARGLSLSPLTPSVRWEEFPFPVYQVPTSISHEEVSGRQLNVVVKPSSGFDYPTGLNLTDQRWSPSFRSTPCFDIAASVKNSSVLPNIFSLLVVTNFTKTPIPSAPKCESSGSSEVGVTEWTDEVWIYTTDQTLVQWEGYLLRRVYIETLCSFYFFGAKERRLKGMENLHVGNDTLSEEVQNFPDLWLTVADGEPPTSYEYDCRWPVGDNLLRKEYLSRQRVSVKVDPSGRVVVPPTLGRCDLGRNRTCLLVDKKTILILAPSNSTSFDSTCPGLAVRFKFPAVVRAKSTTWIKITVPEKSLEFYLDGGTRYGMCKGVRVGVTEAGDFISLTKHTSFWVGTKASLSASYDKYVTCLKGTSGASEEKGCLEKAGDNVTTSSLSSWMDQNNVHPSLTLTSSQLNYLSSFYSQQLTDFKNQMYERLCKLRLQQWSTAMATIREFPAIMASYIKNRPVLEAKFFEGKLYVGHELKPDQVILKSELVTEQGYASLLFRMARQGPWEEGLLQPASGLIIRAFPNTSVSYPGDMLTIPLTSGGYWRAEDSQCIHPKDDDVVSTVPAPRFSVPDLVDLPALLKRFSAVGEFNSEQILIKGLSSGLGLTRSSGALSEVLAPLLSIFDLEFPSLGTIVLFVVVLSLGGISLSAYLKRPKKG